MHDDRKREPGPRPTGWRRESAHKGDRNQFGFTIRSSNDRMPLTIATDPAGMDELGESKAPSTREHLETLG